MSFASQLLAAAWILPAGLIWSSNGADIDTSRGTGQSASGFRPLVSDDRPATPILAPASKEGEIRIKQFSHVPDLKIDLWAAEPMLANPVAFCVDETGRVFTSETYRYRTSVLDIRHYMFMLEDDLAARNITNRLEMIRKWFGPAGEAALSRETEVIRLLEDTNRDGRADKSEVLADGFTSPLDGIASGVLARKGEVWVTDIPSVWRFSKGARTEERGARIEDPLVSNPRVMKGYQAEELLRGFGVRFSFTGHDLHGLKFGPDGRLYFSCGDRGAHIVTKEGNVIDLPDEGAVFRCEPDGSNLEVVHRGLRNPQELAFNEYGDLFTGDNDSDQGDRERWVQVVEGGDSGWRVGHQHAPLGNAGMWNLERLWVPCFKGQAAYIIPPIANIGDGPSGLVYDYGTSLPGSLTNRFLLAYFKGTSAKSGLYSLRLRPAGASYELVAHDEFVWNSLVPDVDLAPDGSIFFADWHEGWPKSNKGRLYRAYFPEVVADPVTQEAAKLLGEGMEKRNEPELLGLLAHRNMQVRQEAQYELAARGPKSFDGMMKVAFDPKHQLARIHAIWGLGQIARVTSDRGVLGRALDLAELFIDADPEIQVQSLRVFADLPVSNFALEVATLSTNSNSRVQTAALVAYPKLFVRGNSAYIPSHNERARLKFMNWWKPGTGNLPSGATSVNTFDPGLHGDLVHDGLAYGNSDDPLVLQAKVQCLATIGGNGFKHLLAVADTNQSGRIRIASLLAHRRLKDPSIQQFLSDSEPLLVLEAARAINDVPITNALPALAELAEPTKLDPLLKQFALTRIIAGQASPPVAVGQASSLAQRANGDAPTVTPTTDGVAKPVPILDVRAEQPLPWGDVPIDQLTPMLLRVVNANYHVGTPVAAARLASLTIRTDLSELIRTEALQALANWGAPAPRDRITGTFRPLPARDAVPAREALAAQMERLLSFQAPPPLTAAEEEIIRQRKAADPNFRMLDTRSTTKVPEPVLMATAHALAQLRPEGSTDALFHLVASRAPAGARAVALRSLAEVVTTNLTSTVHLRQQNGRYEVENFGGDAATAEAYWKLGTALSLATHDTNEVLRLAASKLSAELNPGDAAGQLAAALAKGSLAEQQSAYESLGNLKSVAADALLAESLDKLMKREVANEVMLDLVEAAAKRESPAVKSRLATYQDWKLPKDHLSPYREALFGGDGARGRKIFYENASVACTRCHQIGIDGGGNAGPKLDNLANRVTREHLLESIVFPNQQGTEGFESVIVIMKDGQAFAGLVRSETAETLVILSPEEGDVTVPKGDIVTREKGLSGMPEGMGQLLTRQELRDLMEFLGSLK